ncbi:MAG TPA: hypothetical protein VM325_15765 [Alphaproteobacteria bacterium]|nr:hypothetical protein [Alphaproteobacteria bacterium]
MTAPVTAPGSSAVSSAGDNHRRYRYPWSELRGDYLRAGFGIALTGLPFIATWGELYAGLILGALMGLFAFFGLRTALRQSSVYEVGDDAIARNGWSILGARRASLAWREVERVKLAFYSTRRDRSKGWMHLTITGGRHTLGIDSILEGFDDIAARGAAAAAANGVAMSDATLRNFAALGLIIEHEDGRAVSASRGGVL